MACQPAIFSCSLGRAWLHGFDHKIQVAAEAGFRGVEIFYEDLDYVARQKHATDTPTNEQLLDAASHCHTVCQRHGLTVVTLQPFLFYEGLKDRAQHDRLVDKMKLWLTLAHALHTDTIQIPANFLPATQITNDLDIIAADLRQVADLGAAAEPPVRFAYENLCWSTYIDTWEKLWDVVQRVDRPNFGACLDTFNIAGRVWADPTSPDGKTPNADADLKTSLANMVKDVCLEKVFFIQVVDAERMRSPLVEGHPFYVEGNPARMNWSRNARTFMYEKDRGAYLPVEDVAQAIICGLGYRGFVSMELFSRTLLEPGKDVPREHAERGMASWNKLVERLRLE